MSINGALARTGLVAGLIAIGALVAPSTLNAWNGCGGHVWGGGSCGHPSGGDGGGGEQGGGSSGPDPITAFFNWWNKQQREADEQERLRQGRIREEEIQASANVQKREGDAAMARGEPQAAMDLYYAGMKLFGNPENIKLDGFPPGHSQDYIDAYYKLEGNYEAAKSAAQLAADLERQRIQKQEEENLLALMRQGYEEYAVQHPFDWIGLSPPPLPQDMPEDIRRAALWVMRALEIDRRANAANRADRAAASEYVRKNYMCDFVGKNGECASLVKYIWDLPETSTWTHGERVQGNTTIRPGTPIATFNHFPGNDDDELTYGPKEPPEASGGVPGKSHAAIYLGQDEDGIWVFDQDRKHSPRVRRIDFAIDDYEGGSRFYVIVPPSTTPRRAPIHTWLSQ